jgi:hypothetical protein
VANYLAVRELVSRCRDYILANMDQENVLEVLILADALGLRQLKEEAMTFIASHFQVKSC